MWDPGTGSLDIATLHNHYRDRDLTPSQVIEAVLQRIDATDDRDNIWISRVSADILRHQAAELDNLLDKGIDFGKSMPLFGIPYAVKDNIDVAGMDTTNACPDHAYVPDDHAAVVQKLMDSGAILIGKTNMDQFATGLVGTRSPYGTPLNPFRPEYLPGGSSSGSAVAVSTGQVSFSLGTDTAGSGRVPAAFNNIVGYKPTRGMISTRGVFPACRSLDCVSIFGLNTSDIYDVTRCIAGYDENDSFSRQVSPDWRELDEAVRPGHRIGIPDESWREFFGDKEARSLYEETVRTLEKRGYAIVPVDFQPFREAAKLLYEGPWVVERYLSFGKYFESDQNRIHPEVRDAVSKARDFSAKDVFSGYYRLKSLVRRVGKIFSDIDCMLLPTMGRPFTLDDAHDASMQVNSKLGYYTNFVNLLDLCAYAVPAGFLSSGMPYGVTFIAPAFMDAMLLDIGNAFHVSLGLNMGAGMHGVPVWNREPVRSEPDRVKICVSGAHMSGLPLNYQMQDSHARYLYTTRTAVNYRLYAFENMDPPRPGMIRSGDGQGIEVEVWEMSAPDFGRFVSRIPSPLGIGTIQLENGDAVKGFLCEQVAVKEARDITSYGGWRAYINA